jgi:medium-chain acyl-[acyl-carrier-protein] hydrolase
VRPMAFAPPVKGAPACLRHAPVTGPARLRLVAVPHAGGAASAYGHWSRRLDPAVAVTVVQPPGRETRSHEAAHEGIEAFVAEVCAAVTGLDPLPTVVFGHSLGAHVAFEVCRRLAGCGPPVVHLVVAGARAPHCPPPATPISGLPDAEFLAALIELGGMPRALLAHADYMDAVLPTVRADIAMAERYQARPAAPLDCPITVFGGDADPLAPPFTLQGWSEHTRGRVDQVAFAGDHFFVATDQDRVLAALGRVLARCLAEPAETADPGR